MFDKIIAFSQKNKLFLQSVLLILAVLASSIFFYQFNYFTTGYSSKMIVILGLISALAIFLLFLLYQHFSKKKKQKALPGLYLVSLLLLGTMYSAVFLPGTAPDETYHYEASYYYSNVITGNTSEDATLNMRETDVEFRTTALSNALTKEHYRAAYKALTSSAINNFEATSFDGHSSNLPQVKIASAIGIVLGQLFGLNGAMTFYLGRFFNFLCFALLAFAAYKITPIGKMLFAAITLLPITLHITSSYSYDATIIGLGLLLTALCFKGIYSEEKCSKRLLVAIPVAAFLLAPCKVLYALIVFLVFLIPSSKFSSVKTAHLYKFSLLGIALLAVILFKLPDLLNMAGVPQGGEGSEASDELAHRGEETGYFYSLSYLLAHPSQTIFVFINTINQQFDFYLNTFLGGSLGWFQAELKTPWFFILLFLGVLLYAARKSDVDSIIPSRKAKTVLAVFSALMFLAVLASMLLGWTFTTEFAIEGVQGRYFLPFAPLFLLLFRTKNTQRNESSTPIIMFSLFALNAMNLIYIWAAMARC